ncbi:MAG TPA: YkgJ family cysteine cluster protein [Gammaproteobacteria bacterium]|nr:YkgJ family cysteine cluster protein [Gammaproteobacteria bacterium]
MSDTASNPCITCGACCAYFRASFHWSESEPSLGGTVPPELTEKLNDHRAVMLGTNCAKPRCIALQGEIGTDVRCSIHPQRSSVCREFPFSGENNQPHDRCDKARAAHGLPPLMPPSSTLIQQFNP